jgi:hypothetical protein
MPSDDEGVVVNRLFPSTSFPSREACSSLQRHSRDESVVAIDFHRQRMYKIAVTVI